MTITTEKLHWLLDAATEMAAVKMKMTMCPDEILSLVRKMLDAEQMILGYEKAAADVRRLTRELDVLLNGENAAQQASLCDIVAQVSAEGIKPAAREAMPVAWTDEDELRDARKGYSGYLFAIDGEANKFADPRRKIMLFTDPPAPAVPREIPSTSPVAAEYVAGWNACRAAMLAAAPATPSAPDDLIMQVRRLVHALKKSNPDHALVKQVPDYMRRAGYWKLTDCLRGTAAAPEVKP